ncbi:cytochrome P450 [Aspergillus bertholletiae]|uniref:Cytochrome P450 n=1 Tax=Aspergillus bertholletiae TaxID=1226010 RepID=A0A5N7B6D0_9EURO|nr:cytochrome P450 [Aspergillus bertholletiae]
MLKLDGLTRWVLTIICGYLFQAGFKVLYRLYFHPLKNFPGPWLAAATGWYKFYCDVICGGQYIFHIRQLEKELDSNIIRVSHNHLLINDPDFFHEMNPSFYHRLPLTNSLPALADSKLHGVRRRQLNPVFTPSAVAEALPTLSINLESIGEILSRAKRDGAAVDIQADFFYLTYCGARLDDVYVKRRHKEKPSRDTGKRTLSDVLLDSAEGKGVHLDRKYLIDESVLFMFVGTDTTAYALSFAIYYLLTHQEILNKLRDELRGSEKQIRSHDWPAVRKLDYLSAVIEEVLRISCPVQGFLPRVVPPSGCLVGSTFIPGGTVISVPLSGISNSEVIFKEPSSFRPERWLGDSGKSIEKWRVQFSLGPYACIGMKLSQMEMTTSLAYIFARFDLALHDTDSSSMQVFDYLLVVNTSHVQVMVLKDHWG